MSTIQLQNVTISYTSKGRVESPVKNLSIKLNAGELVAVIGSNGTGKSSLLRVISGLQTPTAGTVYWKGKSVLEIPIEEKPKEMAFMFSQYTRVEGMKVEDLVMLGRYPYLNRFGKPRIDDKAICESYLSKVGLQDKAKRSVSSLSDGEFRKGILAKLLAQECPIMVLDEPTTFLDIPSQLNFMKLLKSEVKRKSSTVVLSTHNLQAALKLADRILLLDKTDDYFMGTPEEIAKHELMCSFLNSSEISIEDGNVLYNLKDEN